MANNSRISWPVYAVGTMAGLGLLVCIIWRSGFSNFFGYLLRARPLLILAAVTVYAIAWGVRVVRIRALTRFYGQDLRWPDLFRFSVSGVALNSLLPANLGDVALIGYLGSGSMSVGLAAAMVIQLRLMDAAAVTSSASLLLPLSLGAASPSWLLASMPVPLLVIGAIVLLIRLDGKRSVSVRLERYALLLPAPSMRYAARKLREAAGGFHDLLKSKRLLCVLFLLSVSIWFIEGLTAWCVAAALGFSPPPQFLFLALYAANLGKALSLTPGGLGIYEGLMATVLTLGGMPYPQAISLAVCDHLLKKLFNLTLGIPATAVFGLSLPGLIKSLKRAPQISEPRK